MNDPNNPEIQVELNLDFSNFEQGLTEAERLMQQGVQRLTSLSQSGQPDAPEVSSPDSGFPSVPLSSSEDPPRPTPATVYQPSPRSRVKVVEEEESSAQNTQQPESTGNTALDAAWEEYRKIQAYSRTAPDIALSALSGDRGLTAQVLRQGREDPEKVEQYQELINALKELTQGLRKTSSEDGEGGVLGMLKMIRAGTLANMAVGVGQQALSGNLIGAGGQVGGAALGALIGSIVPGLGTLAGLTVGAGIGGGIGSSLQGVVNSAGEARKYEEMITDISGRFGDFEEVENLQFENIRDWDRSGYSVQDTAGLVDALRQYKVVGEVDESTKELVESLQALTRATGINTDALVKQYAEYKNMGTGDASNPQEYMAKVLEGAIAAGFKSNLQEYSELIGSARMQLVYKSGQGDLNDATMTRLQSIVQDLAGGDSSTASLLRNNPMMLNQAMNNYIASGSTNQRYGYESIAMQLAGIDRSRISDGFTAPEHQAENAQIRTAKVMNDFLAGGGLGIMGFESQEQLQAAIKANPNLLYEKISSRNENTEQAAALQDLLSVYFKAQYGKEPGATDVQLFTQLGSVMLQNQGNIPGDAKTPDGKTIDELLKEVNQTEGDKSRQAADARHTEMMGALNNFTPMLISMDEQWVTFTPKLVKCYPKRSRVLINSDNSRGTLLRGSPRLRRHWLHWVKCCR
ncbi:MAG: hypothetical protein LRZ84_14445 [Desertifilum sp.]|nr:hypothetical protein [Desertifilum sp.]